MFSPCMKKSEEKIRPKGVVALASTVEVVVLSLKQVQNGRTSSKIMFGTGSATLLL